MPNVLLYSHQNGNVYLSDYRNPFNWSFGYSWIYMTPPTATGMLFINPYIINQSDEKILYYAGGSTIWRNNNINISDDVNTTYSWNSVEGYYESNQWEELTALTSASTITALATTKSDPENRLFYGDAAGQVYRRNGANTGTGAALNVTSSDFPSNAYVSSISTQP